MFFNYFTSIHSGGDWPVFYQKTIQLLPVFPSVWSPTNGNGLGQNVSFVLGYKTFFNTLVILLTQLGLPWVVVEKLIFFIPFFLLSGIFSYFFARYFLHKRWLSLLASFIYVTNTYALMLVGGGQMGVAIAYCLAPAVLLSFIHIFDLKPNSIKNLLICGLVLGLQLMIDPRIAGVTLLAGIIYFVISSFYKKSLQVKAIIFFFLAIICAVFINLYWILPFILVRNFGLSEAYTSGGIVSFLSFARLENTISLLHPNWPENIFGKVYFMRPEFLIIPIIAFLSLLVNSSKKNGEKYKSFIVSFAVTALVGAFFAKGTNEPFGQLFQLMIDYLPGFIIFRDPTKFYPLIALSYSVLIPYCLGSIGEKRFYRIPQKMQTIIYISLFLILWLFSTRELWTGQLAGTFRSKKIPSDYLKFAQHVRSENQFYRILWVPQIQRFGYFSNENPPVSANDLYHTSTVSAILKELKKIKAEKNLSEMSVKYVIVPYDSQGEIFLEDRKYSEKEFRKTLSGIHQLPWLKQVAGFDTLGVFEMDNPKGHFWIAESGPQKKKSILSKSPSEYLIQLSGVSAKDRLVMSESYDPNWHAFLVDEKKQLMNEKYKNKYNSFIVKHDGDVRIMVSYTPQGFVRKGLFISIITGFGILILLIIVSVKK